MSIENAELRAARLLRALRSLLILSWRSFLRNRASRRRAPPLAKCLVGSIMPRTSFSYTKLNRSDQTEDFVDVNIVAWCACSCHAQRLSTRLVDGSANCNGNNL